MRQRFVTSCVGVIIAISVAVAQTAQGPRVESVPQSAASTPAATRARATGDQRRQYVFAPTGQSLPYRLFVPPTWDGKTSLPIILMLHGGGANENTYMDMSGGLLPKLAAQHGYIVVSPLGFTPL